MSEENGGPAEYFRTFPMQEAIQKARDLTKQIDHGGTTAELAAGLTTFQRAHQASLLQAYKEEHYWGSAIYKTSRLVTKMMQKEKKEPFLEPGQKQVLVSLFTPAIPVLRDRIRELPPREVSQFERFSAPLMQLVDLSKDPEIATWGAAAGFGNVAMHVLADDLLPKIKNYVDNPEWVPGGKVRVIPVIEKIMAYGNPEQQEQAKHLFEDYFMTDDATLEFADELPSKLLNNKSPELSVLAFPVVEKELAVYGWEFADLIDDWRASCGEKNLGEMVRRNTKMIVALEKEIPGCTKTLTEEFGIKCFGRYPKELLLRQFREKDIDMPYGIILNPRGDHDGTFYNNIEMYASLYQQLSSKKENKYGVRVIEAGSKRDILHRLTMLQRKYGSENKIAFGIIGGHGTQKSVRFDRTYRLEMDEFIPSRRDLLQTLFAPDGTLLIDSCFTGVDNGFAQRLSSAYGGRVLSSANASWLDEVTVGYAEDGSIELRATYKTEDPEQGIIKNVETVTYLAGAKVS